MTRLDAATLERNRARKREAEEVSEQVAHTETTLTQIWAGRVHPKGLRSVESMMANLPACLSEADRIAIRERHTAYHARVVEWRERPVEVTKWWKGLTK